MKKLLVSVFITSILLSSCSKIDEINTQSLEQETSLEALAANDVSKMSPQEIEKILIANQKDVEKVAKMIFQNNFSDEAEIQSYKNDFVNPEFKGGVIFNILNKSSLGRGVLSKIGNYVVKKKFAKPDIVDTIPRVNDSQANQLLSVLKAGDVILCGNDSSFIHAIVYEGNGTIIHSLGSPNPKFWGVVKEPLKTYLARSERDKFVVLRAKNTTPDDIKKELEFANKQIGKKYDALFLLNDDDAFYCTELAFRSLLAMDHKPRIFPHKVKFGWELVENTDIMDSPDLQTIWTLGRDRAPISKIHTY
ncbi:MAG: YiiX/YebB-like N1pC/P60 family cysteine hydrolase [Cyanobacteriota bacterium]